MSNCSHLPEQNGVGGERLRGIGCKRVPLKNVEKMHCVQSEGMAERERLFSPYSLGAVGCKALEECLPGIHGSN